MQQDLHSVYDSLFRKTYAKLFFYAKGMVGNDEDAQDVVEDVFTDLWQRRSAIEFGDRVQSMLYRSVYTRSINVLKRRKMSLGYIQLMEDINSQRIEFLQGHVRNPESDLENDELRQILHTAINELPIKCREVFKLSYIQGLHNVEIAELTGTSVRTVEAHMYLALKNLRKKLYKIAPLFVVFHIWIKYLL